MIIWNVPDKCEKCGCKEVYPYRPEIAVPHPGEMYWRCADESCRNFWKTKILTSRELKPFVIHVAKRPVVTAEGVQDGGCDLLAAIAPSPEGACEILGIDGESNDFAVVDVYSLEEMLEKGSRGEHVEPDTE